MHVSPPVWYVILLLACGCAAEALALDCNINAVDDDADIAAGVSLDCNANEIPDECEVVRLLFAAEGEPAPLAAEPQACVAADLDGDGRAELVVAEEAPDDTSTLHIFLAWDGATFATEQILDAGTRASFVLAPDIDQDGDLDLVSVHWDVVLVFKNRGDGSFEPPAELSVPAGTRSLAIADITGNGAPDLVTANPTEDLVSWLPNRGDGSFGRATSFPVLDRPDAVAAADFDGDGDADLAVAGAGTHALSVLTNQGTGGFVESSHFETPHRMTSVVTGDLDEDGHVDIVGGTWESTLVWFGDGSGGFSARREYPIRAAEVHLVDLDEDQHLDLLVGSFDQALMTALRNPDGTGLLSPPRSYSVDFDCLAQGDFDADGDIDLAAAASGPNRLNVLVQGASRGLLLLERTSHRTTGRPHGVAAGDFTGDGHTDVVTAHSVDGTSKLFYGSVDGALEPADLRVRLRPWGQSVVVADLDEDGVDDLVYSGQQQLTVLLSLGDGEFREETSYWSAGYALYTITADVDLDGHIDVVAPRGGGAIINYGDGLGGLSEFQSLEGGTRSLEVAVGDLDGDGRNDVVTANQTSSDLSLFFQTKPRAFLPARIVPVSGQPHAVAVADFDRDGRLDLASANEGTQDISIILNRGDRSFSESARVPLGRAPYAMLAADMDGDSLPDLVTTNEAVNDISVVRGRGDGTFAPAQHFRVGSGPRLTVPTDLNRDGQVDLVVAERGGHSISAFVNRLRVTAASDAFLPTLCTEVDFERLSLPSGAPSAERVLRFLLPVDADALGLPALFVNVGRFATDDDFLRTSFPERFGNLSSSAYAALIERRATRELFAGSLYRLRLEDGPVAYGWDVTTETSPTELLGREELDQLFAALGEVFTLRPLIYFPRSREAQERAATLGPTTFDVLVVEDEEPSPPPVAGAPTFELEIAAGTELCGVFGEAGAERGSRDEYELKSVVRLRPGVIELPTDVDTFQAELFEDVRFGPTSATAQAMGAGEFRVTRIPGDVTTYRFTYSQEFTSGDGRRLELAVVAPIIYEARGDAPLERRRGLSEAFFVALQGREPLQARLDGEPLIRYGSCTYEALPRWETRWELADGVHVRLEERFQQAESLFDTGPAALVRAEFDLAGDVGTVTTYTELIYSASRHNTLVDYWVILSPPVTVAGIGQVHAIELKAPEVEPRRDTSAAYLGADFERLASPHVVRFERRLISEQRFVRGDVSADGRINLVDVTTHLDYLFRHGPLPCRKTADANDDARVNLIDAVTLLGAIFGREMGLPAPFPTCGEDPTVDGLSCETFPLCDAP